MSEPSVISLRTPWLQWCVCRTSGNVSERGHTPPDLCTCGSFVCPLSLPSHSLSPLVSPPPVVWHFLHDSLSPNCTCCCLGKGLQRECNSQWPIEFVQAPSAMDETSTRENKDLEENWIKGLRREASWQVSDTKMCAFKRIKSQHSALFLPKHRWNVYVYL